MAGGGWVEAWREPQRRRSRLWLMGEVKVAGVGLGVMDERAATWL